ncbi:MAG TPA: hypothetical protein VFN09_11675 [Rhodanobacteraceae bacterium]|nr:hypothetical protein [Rhodanobacteraceae bacterium]
MDATDDTPTRARLELTLAWPKISDRDGADLLAFWQREGAIPDETQAKARLAQVVFLARDTDGDVAGVCTALAMTPPQLGQPLYFWRAFVAPKWRSTRLIGTLLARSCEHLREYARERDFPCIGVLLELENARFREKGRRAEWVRPRFAYIGKSPRGLDVRVHYFRGARLK